MPHDLATVWGSLSKTVEQADGTLVVSGFASSEARDSQGESVLASAMRKAIAGYFRDGPTVTESHDLRRIAGKALSLRVLQDGRTALDAHVVDPTSVLKVRTGVLRGFSIAGAVTKRNAEDPSIIEGLSLREIALVDRPANPDARFVMWKFEDLPEQPELPLDVEPEVEPAVKATPRPVPKSRRCDICGGQVSAVFCKEHTVTRPVRKTEPDEFRKAESERARLSKAYTTTRANLEKTEQDLRKAEDRIAKIESERGAALAVARVASRERAAALAERDTLYAQVQARGQVKPVPTEAKVFIVEKSADADTVAKPEPEATDPLGLIKLAHRAPITPR